jgi:transposase
MEQERKTRRHYDQQFKVDAVRLLEESGRPLAEVARELGIGRSELRRWKKQQYRPGQPASAVFPGNGNISPEKKELEELRRELARVKEEREILKKAMAVFSRRP